jgi:hypothetical protein
MGTATSIMMGVADMPIQTLKLLNIHPDSRAAKKGKEKAAGDDDATSTGELSRTGRPSVARTTTDATNISVDRSGASTPTLGSHAPQSKSYNKAGSSPDTPGSPTHRSTFMSQAFAESAQGSRSPSRDRLGHRRRASSISAAELRSNNGTASPRPATPGPGLAESMESAVDTGKGLARIIGAGFKSPMDFSLNVAKGLHNVPKLYGAEVRQVDKVTDLQSGLRTAAKVCFILCNPRYNSTKLYRNSASDYMMALLVLSQIPTKARRKKALLALSKESDRAFSVYPFGFWVVPGQYLATL